MTKGKLKKVISITLGAILSMGLLTACGSNSTKNPTTEEVMNNIKDSVKLDSMKEGNEEKLTDLVGVDASDVEEFAYYMPTTNLQANQVAVIKVKDEEKVDDIKSQIENKINESGEEFKTYLPEEYFLIENKVIESEGKYILVAVSKDSEEIEGAFEDSLK